MSANKPDIQQIRKYLNGELDARAMFEVERQAQGDPFWMDVLQGMESGDEHHRPKLDAIDMLLENRVQQEKKAIVLMWRTWSVAACVLLGLSIGGWWLLRNPNGRETDNKLIANKITVLPDKLKTGQPPLRVKVNPVDTPTDKPINLTKLKPAKATPLTIIAQAPPQLAAVPAAPAAAPAKTDTGNNRVTADKALGPSGYSNASARNSVAKLSQDNAAKLKRSDTAGFLKGSAKNTLKEELINSKPDTLPRQVLISKVEGVEVNKPENGAYQNLSGKVTELGTGNPIADAAIRIAGQQMAARSAADGTFKISAPANSKTVEVNSIGYQGKRVNVSGRDSLKIALAPDNNSLSEVVVVRGSGALHKIAVNKSAHPAMGWGQYKKYLNAQATITDDKKVSIKLSFDVDANGAVSNMHITDGSTDELNRRAGNLILDGPKWVGAANGKTEKVKLTVRFHQ